MVKEYTKKEIQQLIEDNRVLRAENASMQKVLDSKRFIFAERVANMYNAFFPVGSVRRKIFLSFGAPARVIKKKIAFKDIKTIEKQIRKNNRIIVMHSIPWNTPLRQRPHHLAACLARKGFMVIYLEPEEPLKKMRIINDNLLTINSWDTLFKIKLEEEKHYYFFFNNVSNIPFKMIEKISEHGYELVYEYIDEFHEDISGSLVNQLENWKRLKELKPRLVLASANKLYDDAKKHFKNVKVMLSKNAVLLEDFDYHRFKDAEVPSDLLSILKKKKPIIGYYGALAPWLDYQLITNAAMSNPDCNFVFIGVNYQDGLSKLDQSLKNVYYLGPKKYVDLPKYSSRFDCAIIPFGLGEIAKGTSPVKLFEYMAMGIPTVGTRDLLECEGYRYVYLAKDKDDFNEKLKLAIKEKKKEAVREELRNQAKENTWMKRAQDIMSELSKD